MPSRRTLRSATLLAAIAFALAACGPLAAGSETEGATETPATPSAQDEAEGSAEPADHDAAATEETSVEIDGAATSETATVEPVSTDAGEPVEDDSSATPAPAPAPPTPTVPEHRRCSVLQGADGGEYLVFGIQADDPDGGLTARVDAGYTYESLGLLPEGAVVSTFIDRPDRPSCLVTRDGGVWWQIVAPSMTSGLWVNSRYLGLDGERVPELWPGYPEEEADVHSDCVYLPDLPDTCIAVYTSGGVIYGADFDNAQAYELVYACVFQDFAPACEILTAVDPAVDVDLELSLSPLDILQTDCESGSGVVQKIACAELGRRL